MAPLSDTQVGILILAVFVPLAMVAGYAIVRFKNWRLSLAWGPLLPHFQDAQIVRDSHSPAGLLRARHGALRFEAAMRPGMARYGDSESTDRFNEFSVALLDVEGGGDWSASLRGSGVLGLGAPAWRLEAKDPALAAALTQAGVLDAVVSLVHPDDSVARTGPVVAYQAAGRRLVLRSDAGRGTALPPEQLQRDLATLAKVAEAQARANALLGRSQR